MSLQSPFGPDIQAQLMGLAGYGQQGPSRNPDDMGTREQFMRMMAENRAQSDQQYQRQMQMMQQGQQNQMELMKQGNQLQMQGAAFQQDNAAYLNQQAAERHIQMQEQMEDRLANINSAMVSAQGDEVVRLTNERAKIQQQQSQLKIARAEAEAKAANIDNLSAQDRETIRVQMQAERDGLVNQRSQGMAIGSKFDYTAALNRQIDTARASASGSQSLGAGVSKIDFLGIGSYSDAHFALQDERIADAAALFGGEEAKAIVKNMQEGGIAGGLVRGATGLAGYLTGIEQVGSATGEDRLKLAAQRAETMSKSQVMMNMIGQDLAASLGVDKTLLEPLMADLDQYGKTDDPQMNEMLKKRINDRLLNIGKANNLGLEGTIQALQSVAASMRDVKETVTVDGKETSRTKSRFEAAGSEGTTANLSSAIGKNMSTYFSNIVGKLDIKNPTGQSVYKSGEFQNAEDLETAYNAFLAATGKKDAAGVETVISSPELMQKLLASPEFKRAYGDIDLTAGKGGRLNAEMLDELQSYIKNLEAGKGVRTGIADKTKQEAELLADPRLVELLDPVAFNARVKREAAKAGETARKRFGPTAPNTPGFKQPKMPGT